MRTSLDHLPASKQRELKPVVRVLLDRGQGPTLKLARYRPGSAQAPHAHPSASLAIVLHGRVEETQRGRTEVATPLSVVVKPAGSLHEDRYGPSGCTLLQVGLPLGLIDRACEALLDRAVWTHLGGAPLKMLAPLLDAAHAAHAFDPDELELLAYEAIAALEPCEVRSQRPPRWLSDVKDRLDSSDPAEAPSVAGVAAAAHVHPVYLTRQFNRYYGTSVREQMIRHRVRAAAALLVGGSMRLTDIAHACGYADQAHFSRQFKASARVNPRRFRALLRRLDEVG